MNPAYSKVATEISRGLGVDVAVWNGMPLDVAYVVSAEDYKEIKELIDEYEKGNIKQVAKIIGILDKNAREPSEV